MAVILGNKYQSKNRDNFRKITGLSEANEKIKPENMPRIYGDIGEVYFNGQSAAGSSTGGGGGNTGTTDPNGGGGSGGGGSGGGSGGSGGSGECKCETLSDALIVNGIPCCVSGVDCEDGKPIQIQLDPNGGVPILPCEEPPNPATDPNGYVVIAYPYPSWECENIMLFDGGDIQGALDAAVAAGGACLMKQAVAECNYTVKWIITGDQIEKKTRTINTPQGAVSYLDYRKFYKWNCEHGTYTGSSAATISVVTNPNSQAYKYAVNAWKKQNETKQYFVKDGKFYDVCDPYGTPPSDDPIVMCDENGNQYKVSPDGKIKAL